MIPSDATTFTRLYAYLRDLNGKNDNASIDAAEELVFGSLVNEVPGFTAVLTVDQLLQILNAISEIKKPVQLRRENSGKDASAALLQELKKLQTKQVAPATVTTAPQHSFREMDVSCFQFENIFRIQEELQSSTTAGNMPMGAINLFQSAFVAVEIGTLG